MPERLNDTERERAGGVERAVWGFLLGAVADAAGGFDLRGGKVWLQHDGTGRAIAEELVAAGIPKEDIVLAFHPARLRQHTGYAVG